MAVLGGSCDGYDTPGRCLARRTPLTANLQKKIVTWGQATAMAAVVGFIAFGWLHGIMESRFQRAVDRELAQRRTVVSSMIATADDNKSTMPADQNHDRQGNELSWQPYSRELLEKLTADGKTVLVDFTADWCLTCKTNEAVALNTTETKQLVDSNRVVTLKADKTQPAPEVDELLKLLGNQAGSIPFYAIFPAENPNRPILLDGLFTSSQRILDALKKAGPSRTAVIGTDESLATASAQGHGG